ncbi:retention module-containing protein, partial [Aeromonas crassostreae]
MDKIFQIQGAVITAIEGQVSLIVDGTEVPLDVGMTLPEYGQLTTGENGRLGLSLEEGHTQEIPPLQTLALQDGAETVLDDEISALQQSIVDGADPTQIFEATAAGEEMTDGGADGTSNGGYINLMRDGAATLAEAGFDTAYASAAEEERPEWLGYQDSLDGGEDPGPDFASPTIGSVTHTVYEAALAGGSAHQPEGAATRGAFSVDLHGLGGEVQILDQRFTLDAGGNAILPEGGVHIETGAGVLHITAIRDGVITYSYQLNEAQSHAPGEGNNTLLEAIPLTVTDSRGESASGSLDVTIVDDVPSITVTDAELSVNEGYAVDGSFSHELGADAVGATLTVEGGTLLSDGRWELEHGFVTLDPAQGTFTFTAKPNAPQGAEQEIVLVVTDGDGDVDKGSVTIVIGQSEAPEIAPILVDEQGLTSTLDGSESAVIAVPDGYTVVSVSGAVNGTLSQNAQGEWVYTLKGSLTHSKDGRDQLEGDVLTVVVKDGQGNKHILEVPVTVVDDVPTAMADTIALQEIDGQGRGNVLDNDSFGADGGTIMGVAVGVQDGPVIGNVGSELQGQYGTLILNADGSYHYVLTADVPAGETVEEQFTYTLKDGDGDTSTTTITVSVQGDN